jgi:tRNA threonylcarbamoyladenosine biosynthesis protein TsaE
MKINFNKKEIPETTENVLEKILNTRQKNATVIALSGDLGVGKTTITQEIAKNFGIKENITSPTFVVMKIYDLKSGSKYYSKFKKLIHIDAYRLESEQELFLLGWEKIIEDKNNIVILEWPERVEKCLSKDTFLIKLTHIDEENREIQFDFE